MFIGPRYLWPALCSLLQFWAHHQIEDTYSAKEQARIRPNSDLYILEDIVDIPARRLGTLGLLSCRRLGPVSLVDMGNIVNTSLPGLTRLEAVELGNVARLDGKVVLPGILGREVLGVQDLGGPGVPDGGVRQGLAPVDGDARGTVVVEHDWCHLSRAVNAVRLASDGESVRGLGDDGVVLRLVLVGGALEAGDGCCVDVLYWVDQYFEHWIQQWG